MVKIGANEVLVSHLQFGENTIIFYEVELEQLVYTKRILKCFEVMSGLRINYAKSVVCEVGVNEDELAMYADLLNYKIQGLPLKFLGLPVEANPGGKSTWKPVLDSVSSKLAGWKRRLLSFVGRLTLIKSVVTSLPIYYLSLFKMPSGVAKEIEKMKAASLWGWE
ncbi:uncharacterized protein LOC114275175 [Camellia sinensis]|uniref:uncharacterized protein LOC114275175 n=1 Tax=Camellia sinensis TaxID=4442 RepID=UPI001035FD9A|nr:uncharacterized protein LOC114275175 [Camellia sinensis]